jgi:hypothetical protein
MQKYFFKIAIRYLSFSIILTCIFTSHIQTTHAGACLISNLICQCSDPMDPDGGNLEIPSDRQPKLDESVVSQDECNQLCEDLTSEKYGYIAEDSSVASVICTTPPVAPTANSTARTKTFVKPVLNVPIPGLCKGENGNNCFDDSAVTIDEFGVTHTNLLGTYVAAWYKFLLIAASIVAVTMLAIAGLQYATAAGNTKQVEQAKKRIWNAVSGMILLLLAYNIAFLIDPKTTAFKPLSIRSAPGVPLDSKFPGSEGGLCQGEEYLNSNDTWQNCMLKTFGSSEAEASAQQVTLLDAGGLTVNKLIEPNIYAIIQEINNHSDPKVRAYDLWSDVDDGSGYIWRCNTSNPRKLSYHSWGMAIDIRPAKNPYCRTDENNPFSKTILSCVPAGSCENICTSSTPTDIPKEIVEIFENHGFEWGGTWPGPVKDYMHFQAKTVCEGGEIGK